eukprot:14832365-Alexandrium_andersonii.AAC.1
MSASLVGSEMCIRDSLYEALHDSVIEAAEGMFLEGARPALSEEPAFIPVSYTHLTLPTICSV